MNQEVAPGISGRTATARVRLAWIAAMAAAVVAAGCGSSSAPAPTPPAPPPPPAPAPAEAAYLLYSRVMDAVLDPANPALPSPVALPVRGSVVFDRIGSLATSHDATARTVTTLGQSVLFAVSDSTHLARYDLRGGHDHAASTITLASPACALSAPAMTRSRDGQDAWLWLGADVGADSRCSGGTLLHVDAAGNATAGAALPLPPGFQASDSLIEKLFPLEDDTGLVDGFLVQQLRYPVGGASSVQFLFADGNASRWTVVAGGATLPASPDVDLVQSRQATDAGWLRIEGAVYPISWNSSGAAFGALVHQGATPLIPYWIRPTFTATDAGLVFADGAAVYEASDGGAVRALGAVPQANDEVVASDVYASSSRLFIRSVFNNGHQAHTIAYDDVVFAPIDGTVPFASAIAPGEDSLRIDSVWPVGTPLIGGAGDVALVEVARGESGDYTEAFFGRLDGAAGTLKVYPDAGGAVFSATRPVHGRPDLTSLLLCPRIEHGSFAAVTCGAGSVAEQQLVSGARISQGTLPTGSANLTYQVVGGLDAGMAMEGLPAIILGTSSSGWAYYLVTPGKPGSLVKLPGPSGS